jgi:hypothetical protein
MNPIRNYKKYMGSKKSLRNNLFWISNGAGKIFLFSLALLFVGLVPHALAQGFVPLAPIPGLTEGSVANSDNLAIFFNNLYKYLIGLAAVLAIIEIIWGGLEISTQDSVSKNQAGKDRIYQALFGLVLVLSPVLVFSIINPSILNLSLNLKKLDTASSSSVTPPTTTCDPRTNTNNAACRQILVDQCVARGGTPQQDRDPLTQAVTITCITSGPLAPGSTITIDQCIGQPTNNTGLPILTTHTCAGATPAELQGKPNCRNLSPEQGICVW